MGAEIEQRFGAPDISLHRAELHAALISINPPAIVHFDKKLVGLDRDRHALCGWHSPTAPGSRPTRSSAPTASIRPCSTSCSAPASRASPDRWPIARSTARELLGTEIDDRVKWWGPDRHIVSYKVDPRRRRALFHRQHAGAGLQDRIMVGDAATSISCAPRSPAFIRNARIILDSCPGGSQMGAGRARPAWRAGARTASS